MNKKLKTKGYTTKVFPPPEGWIEHGVYLVEVSANSNNPIHQAIFYTGYLNNKGEPANYNQLWNPTWDGPTPIDKMFYVKIVYYLGKLFDERVPNLNKLFRDIKLELAPGEYNCKVEKMVKDSNSVYTVTLVLK